LNPRFHVLRRCRAGSASGQSLIEFALVLPLVLVVALGVIETSWALLDEHVVTKLSREGSNLISRDTTMQDATTAMRQMATLPVNFDNGSSTVIFSVIKRGAISGTANYDKPFLYQRFTYGTHAGTSQFNTYGVGSFGGAPDYMANNPDTDASLQITNGPPNLVPTLGSLIYVTEIFSQHQLLTPLDRFGIAMPTTLSSIAYF
jgi:Flp pilus assembly protein TadG